MDSKLFISPHNDDETLFGAFTLIREKPLVIIVTDGYIQSNRGDQVTADQRREETKKAMAILGCKVEFAGIRDDDLTEENLREFCKKLWKRGFRRIWLPAIHEEGNTQHNLISKIAYEELSTHTFTDFFFYTTYSKNNLYETGKTEIIPTEEEINLKNQALLCYQSQIDLPATRPHFAAVMNKSEWYA